MPGDNVKTISDHISEMNERFDYSVDVLTRMAFDAFENRSNGRLAGAYMRIANANRRYLEEISSAIEVIQEELDGDD